MLVQNKMRDALTLLVIGIATAIGGPPFPSFTVITTSMHFTYRNSKSMSFNHSVVTRTMHCIAIQIIPRIV
jgi:hypothetical protein